jgi:hypothetical protein
MEKKTNNFEIINIVQLNDNLNKEKEKSYNFLSQ